MKKILTIMLFALAMTANAQKLVTETDVIDVGQVLFNTPVTATFDIKNKSSKQVLINKVESSCGCTTTDVPTMVVGGGKSMTIRATYDSKQLGHFYKQILVYEDGRKKPLELVLKGVVVEELEDFAGSYPFEIGQIHADRRDIEFDDVNRGAKAVQEIHILNTTGETIQPVVMHLPAYLHADVSPTRIAPKKGGVITFTLLSDKIRDFGLSQTSVFLGKYPGDKVSSQKEITTSVVLLPSFEGVGETQLQYTPHVELSDSVLYLSKMQGKPARLKGEILVKNTGRTTLDIRSLQMFTAGLSVSLSKQKIDPGETARLKIQADYNELKQQHTRPRILMITNDPQHPKVVIEVRE